MDIGNIRPEVFQRRPTTVSNRDSVKTLAQFVLVQGENKLHSETQTHHSKVVTPGLKPYLHSTD